MSNYELEQAYQKREQDHAIERLRESLSDMGEVLDMLEFARKSDTAVSGVIVEHCLDRLSGGIKRLNTLHSELSDIMGANS